MDVDLIQAGYIQVDSKGGIAQGNLDLGAGNGKLTLTQEGHNFSGVCFSLPGERFLCMTVIVCVCVCSGNTSIYAKPCQSHEVDCHAKIMVCPSRRI